MGDSLTLGLPRSAFFDVLRRQLLDDELINLGWGNDTVVSLYRRAADLRPDGAWDLQSCFADELADRPLSHYVSPGLLRTLLAPKAKDTQAMFGLPKCCRDAITLATLYSESTSVPASHRYRSFRKLRPQAKIDPLALPT